MDLTSLSGVEVGGMPLADAWDAACLANVAPSGRNSNLLSYPGLRRPPGASPGAMHGAALWAACGVRPEDVWREMDRRESLLGIAEKLPKSRQKNQSAYGVKRGAQQGSQQHENAAAAKAAPGLP